MKRTWIGLATALTALACSEEAPLSVARVDLRSFEGGYFEIAKLPRLTEVDCTGTTAFHERISDTELAIVHECREGSLDGPLRRVAARAVVTDKDEPGKLSVNFGGFYGDYWIVEVADDYRFAAVGHPSRDYLWILSRTPVLDAPDLDALLERLRLQKFDVSRLEFTEQRLDAEPAPAAPSGDTSTIPRHGCAFFGPASGSRPFLVLASSLLLAVFVRRLRRRSAARLRRTARQSEPNVSGS